MVHIQEEKKTLNAFFINAHVWLHYWCLCEPASHSANKPSPKILTWIFFNKIYALKMKSADFHSPSTLYSIFPLPFLSPFSLFFFSLFFFSSLFYCYYYLCLFHFNNSSLCVASIAVAAMLVEEEKKEEIPHYIEGIYAFRKMDCVLSKNDAITRASEKAMRGKYQFE